MIDPATALGSVKKADEALSVIGKLVAKLKAQPDLAALKLAEALDEIRKTFQALDTAITHYLKLGIDRDAMDEGSEVLLRIEGGGLLAEVKDGMGHCHIIENIYDNYLDRWFERALKGEELTSIHRVFDTLIEADADVFEYMEEVAEQIQTEASEVLDLVIDGKVEEARKRVLVSRKELMPLRLGMSGTLEKLYSLKSEFIQMSGVT